MTSLDRLKEIPRINNSIIQNFKDAGYESLEDLTDLTKENLEYINGVGEGKLNKIYRLLDKEGIQRAEKDENYLKFKELLEKLFKFESADLDFGIYKIINEKRDHIDEFLEEELQKKVEGELDKFLETKIEESKEKLEKAKNEIRRDFPNWTNEEGEIVEDKIPEQPEEGIMKERIQNYKKAKEKVEKTEISEEIEASIYQDLYRFFKRYYEDGDFIPQRRASNSNKYAIPYNGEEVKLHWANKDQYFVKTGEKFKDYQFDKNSYSIKFKLHNAQLEKNNKKGVDKYFLLRENDPIEQESRFLTVHFEYRPLTDQDIEEYDLSERSRTKSREIQEQIKEKILFEVSDSLEDILNKETNSQYSDSTVLEKHLKNYRTKNNNDYFIHKNLGEFLELELENYLKNDVFSWKELTNKKGEIPTSVRARINAIENIAQEIISLLASIEDFQKKLFEKKKFVVDSEYCMTLDKVPEEIYSEILENEEQIEKWKELYALNEQKNQGLERFIGSKELDENFLKQNQSMMIDTKFLSEKLKYKILKNLEPLDKSIEGIAIKSENFQALEFLSKKFKNKISASYIDPPYNTGSDTFVYKDNFQSSSWISMMFDRMSLSRDLLNIDGKLFVSIGDDEFSNLKKTMDEIFSSENFVADIIWNSTKSVTNPAPISDAHTHNLFFAKDKQEFKNNKDEFRLPAITEGFDNPDGDPRGPWKADPFEVGGERPNQRYEITNPETGETFTPKEGNSWKNDYETFQKLKENDRIVFGKSGQGRPKRKRFLSEAKERGTTPTTLWDDVGTTTKATRYLRNMFGERDLFNNPKPVKLVKRFAKLSTNSEDYFVDFFAGSGTTAEAIIELNKEEETNRKYIVIDMGTYFEKILKSRIIKSVYSGNWDDGTPQDRRDTSHLFKYYSLEQYEDCLNNIISSDEQTIMEEFTSDTLEYYLNFGVDGPSLLDLDGLKDPFNYEMLIREGDESKKKTINLIETFNHLLGLKVEKIRRYEKLDREYRIVKGSKDEENIIIIWRPIGDDEEKEFYEKERDFIESKILENPDKIYINHDSALEGAKSIEKKFEAEMWK